MIEDTHTHTHTHDWTDNRMAIYSYILYQGMSLNSGRMMKHCSCSSHFIWHRINIYLQQPQLIHFILVCTVITIVVMWVWDKGIELKRVDIGWYKWPSWMYYTTLPWRTRTQRWFHSYKDDEFVVNDNQTIKRLRLQIERKLEPRRYAKYDYHIIISPPYVLLT